MPLNLPLVGKTVDTQADTKLVGQIIGHGAQEKPTCTNSTLIDKYMFIDLFDHM